MELTVTNNQMHFSFIATTIRFPPLQLSDIEVLKSSYEAFMQDANYIIKGECIGSAWCHVLPSMKKGQIVSISRHMPTEGPFHFYKDIKRHWKNSYGYRLPENEEDIIYFQIHFRPLGDRLFTYPNVCLRARDVHSLPRVDPKPILTSFLQDLRTKVSTVCGYTFKFQTKGNFTTFDLNESAAMKINSGQSNLGNKNNSKEHIIYRNKNDIERMVRSNPKPPSWCRPVLSTSSMPKTHSQLMQSQPNSPRRQNQSLPAFIRDGTESVENIDLSLSLVQSRTHSVSSSSETCIEIQRHNGSCYESKCLNVEPKNTENRNDSFKIMSHDAKKANKISMTANKENGFILNNAVPPQVTDSNGDNKARIIPQFTVRKHTVSMPCRRESPTQKTIPVFKPKLSSQKIQNNTFRTSSLINETTGTVKKSTLTTEKIQKSSLTSQNPERKSTIEVANIKNVQASTITLSQISCQMDHTKQINITDTTQAKCQLPQRSTKDALFEQKKEKVCSDIEFCQSSVTISAKRALPTNDDNPKIKKARSKPVVQDLNIEILAKEGKLNKVNSITLISWLKSKGISCRSKDKKADLEEKVRLSLNMCANEV